MCVYYACVPMGCFIKNDRCAVGKYLFQFKVHWMLLIVSPAACSKFNVSYVKSCGTGRWYKRLVDDIRFKLGENSWQNDEWRVLIRGLSSIQLITVKERWLFIWTPRKNLGQRFPLEDCAIRFIFVYFPRMVIFFESSRKDCMVFNLQQSVEWFISAESPCN